MGTPEARFARGRSEHFCSSHSPPLALRLAPPSESIWSTSIQAKRRRSLIASQLRIALEKKESDEHAYWENMRIQDEIDEMNDRDRECDEMMEYWEREEEKKEKKKRYDEKSESLEELRKNLTFIENADGTLELVKRDDCNAEMDIHIYKVR